MGMLFYDPMLTWYYLGGRCLQLLACYEFQEAAAPGPGRSYPGLTAQHPSRHQEPDPGETSAASHHLPAQPSMLPVMHSLDLFHGIKETQ